MNNQSFSIHLQYSKDLSTITSGQLRFTTEDETSMFAGVMKDGKTKYESKSFGIFSKDLPN